MKNKSPIIGIASIGIALLMPALIPAAFTGLITVGATSSIASAAMGAAIVGTSAIMGSLVGIGIAMAAICWKYRGKDLSKISETMETSPHQRNAVMVADVVGYVAGVGASMCLVSCMYDFEGAAQRLRQQREAQPEIPAQVSFSHTKSGDEIKFAHVGKRLIFRS